MARTTGKTKTAARRTGVRAHKSARRSRGKVAARGRVTKAAPKKHRFVVSHHVAGAFEGGMRRYAKYRDLGIAAATDGMVRAHVIKFVPPFIAAEVSKPHYHDVEFQMIYVLKGWMKSEFEGQGAITMREGSCWIQPPKIKHTVLGYSDDCEVLEIILPADFETVELE
jgi:mannose-6-phosphate isomerase-like protein (cupin superfamily)